MQLILDSETTIDIKRNMSTFNEESLVEKLDDVIPELKSNICNSNKENIEKQNNIITSDDNELNSDSDKGNTEDISATKSLVSSKSVDTEIMNDKNNFNHDVTTEDSNQQIPIEETQGIFDQKSLNDATIDLVEQHASIENQEALEIVDQQAHSEAVCGVVEQQPPSEETLGVDDQQAINEKSLSIPAQQANEEALRVDDQQASSKEPLVVNDQQAANENSVAMDYQKASNEKTLGVHDLEPTSKDAMDVEDQQDLNDDTPSISQQQTVSEETLSIVEKASNENQQHSSEETDDVDNQQDPSEQDLGTVQQQSLQTLSEETVTKDEQQEHNSSEDIVDVGGQQRSNEEIDTVQRQAPSEETLSISKQHAFSEKTSSVIDQASSEKTLGKVDEEFEKDGDSDPIVIAYENETPIEEKERPTQVETQKLQCLAEEPTQKSDDILNANNSATSKEGIEVVELDDEEKEDSPGKSLDTDQQKETDCVDATNDDLLGSSMIDDKDDLCHNKNINGNETTNAYEPMEIDNSSEDISVKENTELISKEKTVILALDGKDNLLDKNDKEDLHQTAAVEPHINDTIINDAEIKPSDSESINEKEETSKKEENTECNQDMEVDKVKPQEKECEESPQIKDEPLGQENKIMPETKTQVHRNQLSEDLKNIPSVLKLSNTLDILSDDEDIEPPKNECQSNDVEKSTEKQCINIEDDDDIMLIDEEDTNIKDNKDEPVKAEIEIANNEIKLDNETTDNSVSIKDNCQKESIIKEDTEKAQGEPNINEKTSAECTAVKSEKPLVPNNFLKSYKKNLADMTRDDLEEFCILKIVESIVDRSNLSDIKAKLKTMGQNIEEYKKKAMMLSKQNRDLQVVLKSIQEEQKKMPGTPITPLKITRSVGMQVLMTEKPNMRRKVMSTPTQNVNGNNATINKSPRTQNPSPRPIKPAPVSQTIPVPRLVPAINNVVKNVNTITQPNVNNSGKAVSPMNGIKTTPVTKVAEKRPLNKVQAMTVDLTDDEPPTKVMTRSSPVTAPPVRLIHPLAQNSPRKVYIPISGPQGQNIRPGQTIMLKTVPAQGPRPRGPMPTPRLPQNQIRMPRIQNRHPAPLPEVKQYQTNHYKALPPAPDLKLSKVENGIVISWKIEGYQEDSYEEIASYQLYAYQESSSPPSTALWKKIGDVKALPLPMACTLTQFMAGFKYYFAVRAVDVRSRFGPFSLPGSILLLNKI